MTTSNISINPPLLLTSLCFVAFLIGFSLATEISKPEMLSIAALGMGCWVATVWLGMLSAGIVQGDEPRPAELKSRTVFQLLLFGIGTILVLGSVLLKKFNFAFVTEALLSPNMLAGFSNPSLYGRRRWYSLEGVTGTVRLSVNISPHSRMFTEKRIMKFEYC